MRILKSYFKFYILLVVLSIGTLYLSKVYAQENTFYTNANVRAIINGYLVAYTAKLKVVSVRDSRRYNLKSQERIVGYPIVGKLKKLDDKVARKISALVLDSKQHSLNVVRRCANRILYGFRFTQGQKKVEFAIGIPCNQLLVAYKDKGNVKVWGAVMADDFLKRILKLLSD